MEAEAIDANGSKAVKSEQVTEKDRLGPLQISVTEKVIFCIDSMVFLRCDDDHIDNILDILVLYIKMKKKISIKPVEFQCLIFYNNSELVREEISEEKDLRSALMKLKHVHYEEECKEFDMNVLFSSLAETVVLPHPALCTENVSPPWIYHCLFLFGNNFSLPVMKETNAFDFLIQSPFFAFDTIYLYNTSFEGNNCEIIGGALNSIYEVVNGYYFYVHYYDADGQYNIFAQLLGHPLMRPPQDKTLFNLKELILEDGTS